MPKLILVTRIKKDTMTIAFASLSTRKKIEILKSNLTNMDNVLNECYPMTAQQKIRGILIAPEYFFSSQYRLPNSQGNTRQVSEKKRDKIDRELQKLSEQFPSILIVAGTIAWSKKLEQGDGELEKRVKRYTLALERRMDDQSRKIWHEQSTYYSDNPLVSARRVLKNIENPSQAENIRISRNTAYIYLKGELCHRYHKNSDFQEVIETAYTNKKVKLRSKKNIYMPGESDGVFTIDNIKFGIEVCLDHSLGTLETNHKDEEVDVHIIVSAFVDNNKSNFKARLNGYVLHASSEERNEGKKVSAFYINNGYKYKTLPLIVFFKNRMDLHDSNADSASTIIYL